MKVYIDSDSLIYEACYKAETFERVLVNLDNKVKYIVSGCGGDLGKLFLTGSDNFRNIVATQKQYKGNRLDLEKPDYYHEARDYLVKEWRAQVINGMEADDACSIILARDRARSLKDWEAYTSRDGAVVEFSGFDQWYFDDAEVIIAHIDKDIDQCMGHHYNWKNDESYFIGEEEGLKNFYMSILTGDTSDNIPGIKGVGPKKAEKALEGCILAHDMWKSVVSTYVDSGQVDVRYTSWTGLPITTDMHAYIIERARLLYMLEEPLDKRMSNMWRPPC